MTATALVEADAQNFEDMAASQVTNGVNLRMSFGDTFGCSCVHTDFEASSSNVRWEKLYVENAMSEIGFANYLSFDPQQLPN